MTKSFGKITLASILAALVVGVPLTISAQNSTAPAPAPAAPAAPANPNTPTPPPKHHNIPFRGKLKSVDQTAKTITLDDKSNRTFQITHETVLMKAGKPATLADGVAGEEVTGTYRKGEDGKMTAVRVYFGGKGAKPTPPAGQ